MEKILESLSDGVLVVDANLRVVFANKAFESLFGVRSDEISGSICSSVAPACGLFSHGAACPHQEALRSGKPVTRQVEHKLQGGWTRILLVEAIPIVGQDGRVERVAAIIRNVTDMAKTEKILRRYAEGLAILYELSSLFLNTKDISAAVDKSIAMIGSYYDADMTAVSLSEPDGKTLRLAAGTGWAEGTVGSISFPAAEDEQAGFTFLKMCPAIVNDYEHDTRFVLPRHFKEHGVRSAVSVPMVVDQRIIGVMCLLYKTPQDVGTGELWYLNVIANSMAIYIEKELGIERLGRSEAFLASVLEGIGEGVIVIGKDLKVISANNSYLAMMKRSLVDVIGASCHTISHGEDVPCFERGVTCPAKKLFDTGKMQSSVHTHYDKDGNAIFVQMNAYPLKNASGEIVAAIETTMDITEKVKLERDLAKRIEELETFYEMAVGRELRMIELKETIETLKEELGRGPKA